MSDSVFAPDSADGQATASSGRWPAATPLKSLITVMELAKLLRVPRSTVYNWTQNRKIPFFKAGKHLRFNIEDVLTELERPSLPPNVVALPERINDSLKIEEEMRKRRDLQNKRRLA